MDIRELVKGARGCVGGVGAAVGGGERLAWLGVVVE